MFGGQVDLFYVPEITGEVTDVPPPDGSYLFPPPEMPPWVPPYNTDIPPNPPAGGGPPPIVEDPGDDDDGNGYTATVTLVWLDYEEAPAVGTGFTVGVGSTGSETNLVQYPVGSIGNASLDFSDDDDDDDDD